MKYSVKVCLWAVLISLLATISLAEPRIQVGQESGSPAVISESFSRLTIWCQEISNGNWIQSQISSAPEEVVTVIADFTSPGADPVISMRWWGLLVNGHGPVQHFVITFYQFGDCSGPAGEPIYERVVPEWTEMESAFGLMEYSATFDAVPMEAGQTYWVSVQAVMDVDTGGNWCWGSSTTELCPSLLLAPSYGILDWTLIYPDLFPDLPGLEDRAFCLYSEGSVRTEAHSWGNVKALFR